MLGAAEVEYKTLGEIAQNNGLKYSTLFARLRRLDLPHIRKGKTILVHPDSYEKLIDFKVYTLHGQSYTSIYRKWIYLKSKGLLTEEQHNSFLNYVAQVQGR